MLFMPQLAQAFFSISRRCLMSKATYGVGCAQCQIKKCISAQFVPTCPSAKIMLSTTVADITMRSHTPVTCAERNLPVEMS